MGTQRSAGRRFDHDYGVTTQAILFLTDLDPESAGDAVMHATHYEPVPVEEFRALLAVVPDDVIARSTFVDVGAGMGRAVLLASESPFKQVVGVEVSPGLFEIASENVKSGARDHRRCNDVRIVHADARIWNYPPGDVVAFMYNPFDAQAMLATAGSLADRRDPGETWLVYHTPVERAVLDELGWTLVAEHPNGVVYRR